ncbi:MAG: LysR family transcriptional regulator [Cohaesibacter sp.]|nr:LysR family transcriptional regulator [Cohaesibacter sp.]
MNLRHLKYFVATAETGQVSRAAAVMSISQSSVTSAIRELEAIVGTDLFIRSAHGMDLTDAGREFLTSCQEILQKVEDATHITHRSASVSGSISLAASYTVLGYFLPYHLDRLAHLHPDLEIKLYELNRESIEEGLLANRFDMAVMLTSNLIHPDLKAETLLRSARRLWVPNGHPFSHQHKVPFRDIAKEDYIMLTIDEAAHTTMKYWALTDYEPNVKLRTSSVEAVRSMIANGRGITILSDMVYRPWSLEGKRITTVQCDMEPPTMDAGLAWKQGKDFSPALQALYSYFQQVFVTPQNNLVAPTRS